MCFEKKHEQITEYPLYLHEDEKGNTEIIGRKGRKVRRVEMGGGMPEGGAPYQQLVTDGNGESKWEEKPFGEETAVILPETGISKDGADYGIKQKVADSVDLVIGEEYTVVYNGIEVERKYTCSEWSTSLMEGIFIGEFGPMDWEQSSCFGRFALFNDGTIMLGGAAQAGDTIAVYKKSVKQIDPKYLPEGVGGGAQTMYQILTEDGETFEMASTEGLMTAEEIANFDFETALIFSKIAFVDGQDSATRLLTGVIFPGNGTVKLEFGNTYLSVNVNTGEIGWPMPA